MENSKYQPEINGVATQLNFNMLDSTIILPKLPVDISLISLDIGGTLTKVVYLTRDNRRCMKRRFEVPSDGDTIECRTLGGLLHFVKFETKYLNEWIEFLQSEQLFLGASSDPWQSTRFPKNTRIKATGGGAYKYGDIFRDRLGISFDTVDEIASVVAGANFLLQEIVHEAFTHICGKKTFISIDQNDLFPYLLVNIGSGVSIIKITGNGKFERVTGTHFGGGTIFGLARLLTNCQSYDEFLELSQHGDHRALDLTVGDIYGEMGYLEHSLSASAIASSFGKVNGNKKLSEYKVEDLATTLLRDFTYHIAQISYLVAALLGLKRIYFGGSYIRGHAYTMDNISYGLNYWSKGGVQAVFLQHEGFLGAVGALLNYEKIDVDKLDKFTTQFSSSISSIGEEFQCIPRTELNEKGEAGLSVEVERLKAEIDRLQNDKVTLSEKMERLESNYALAVRQETSATNRLKILEARMCKCSFEATES